MRFNYDLYRPKKIIQDAWNSNSAYFRSKDVNVTPLTKIGDADKIHTSQSSGRIPALAKKFKPKKRLVLSEILPRRRRIFVRSADSQKRVEVRIRTPLGRFAKQLNTMPVNDRATGKLTARVADIGRELNAVIQRNWQARRNVLSQLLLAVMVIGAGAGSVHAYINRSHTMRTDPSSRPTNQTTTQSATTPTTKNDPQEAPPTPPEPPATPAPQNPTPATSTTASSQPAPSTKPPATINNGIKENAAPAPTPQDPSSVPPPVPTTPTPPSTPVNPPDPSTPPADQPEPPTPPSNEPDTPPAPDENQDTTNGNGSENTNTDIHITLPTPRNVTTPQEQQPSTQSPAKQ